MAVVKNKGPLKGGKKEYQIEEEQNYDERFTIHVLNEICDRRYPGRYYRQKNKNSMSSLLSDNLPMLIERIIEKYNILSLHN